MENLCTGTLEEILKRLEVRDLIRCKSVCKSWLSLISSSLFIKSHLKHSYHSDRNNVNMKHRRIAISIHPDYLMYRCHKTGEQFFNFNDRYLLGSCNGLVSISPRCNEVVVINPLTREARNVPNPQIPETEFVCWGFGYDSITDDYKIVLGFRKGENCTCFQMFSLRSKVWKVIGEVNHAFISTAGILCKGMLHWVAYNSLAKQKDVIISFHLTDEEFSTIHQPDDAHQFYFGRVRTSICLGIIEDCLCMFDPSSLPPCKVWAMKDFKKQSWEVVGDVCENGYDAVHCIRLLTNYIQYEGPLIYETLYCHSRAFLWGPLYVESLVSPHSLEPEEEEA
ncbi:putative F-box domain-containing protein [Helianthus debilis subsp. tardiflorus]